MSHPLPAAVDGVSWEVLAARELDRDSWGQLVRNEIPAVVIRDFATPEECSRLVERAQVIGFEAYEQVVPPIDRIGATVFEHVGSDVSSYFGKAEHCRAIQAEIFSQSFSPMDRLMSRLRQTVGVPVQVAADPRHGSYCAGLIRRIENGTLLHIDFAPAEQPDWWVAQVQAQLAWNLYLELDPENPGKTYVYNRPWTPADEAYKIPDTYGYQPSVVGSAAKYTLKPTRGDVYIFNTRNFHEVDPSGGRRTTVTSQMGTLPDGRIILWS
ncbi:hypothetical protein [Corallococcus sp. 4LFB]|uniref:2OG-Fe(II)-dependent halogenase WelO5 family protein n=1 Tax=Corallococcus sp. 4LFB TaxID=3383249 RepID=UPI0039768B77